MYMGFPEEGDTCPESNCNGKLEYQRQRPCSCHINPPCSACTDSVLVCGKCSWEDDSPDYKYVSVLPGVSSMEWRPKPLDKTKIDYRIKMHSSCTQLVEGVYPEGATKADVLEKVKGTFGGRFEWFGGGRFRYVAYTD